MEGRRQIGCLGDATGAAANREICVKGPDLRLFATGFRVGRASAFLPVHIIILLFLFIFLFSFGMFSPGVWFGLVWFLCLV